ncbi:6-cysteine protein [Plasmodium sp. gorilla clade G2]|uniref:6-cysteine protein n=1 Tax=Plasmodium sp. gorilla clade G2 TaxID=880535 RepID=UPI000D228E25|nr:6-cysteine protein [Plasmodium sp. gorilla clade G2]SOV12526.1 6-cysteine protein [Plasmodium sp. gorilla clade G2]
MMKLNKNYCLGISFVLYFLLSVCEGNNNLTCDFNNMHKLDFHANQQTSVTKICTLNPKELDKVTIICGSDSLDYNLYPENCFEEVYISTSKTHKEKLIEYVKGSSMIMKKSLKPNKYNEVSFRVPPNTMPEKAIYCFCENKKIINTNGSYNGSSQHNKEIINRGIAQIVIPSITEKIKGCDFTTKESSIFTKGYDMNDINNSKYKDQDLVCTINASAHELIGFKCPSTYSVEPHDCFVSAYNLSGKNENLESKLKLTQLIMDHYNNTFYSRLPGLIPDNMKFFCVCSKENEKKLVFNVEVSISSSNSYLSSRDNPSNSSFLTFSSYYALITFVITTVLSFIL